jgi:hypothetical protein
VRFVSGDVPAETAEMEANYQTSPVGDDFELKVSTRKLSFAALRVLPLDSTELAAMTLLKNVKEGEWRGNLRYAHPARKPGEWTGDYELVNTRVDVDGLAAPVAIASATVNATANQVKVSKIRAAAGEISFTGDYAWNSEADVPHTFHLQVPAVQAADLEMLLLPTLTRQTGVLNRTLRTTPPPPAWMAERKAEGTISVQTLRADGHRLRLDPAAIQWDGAKVRISLAKARLDDNAALDGELTVSLDGEKPAYEFTGKVADLPFKGGVLEVSGKAAASGLGAEVLTSLRTDGTFHGRSLAFAPEAFFRKASGTFTGKPGNNGSRDVHVTVDEAVQGAETFTGNGVTEPDGTLRLELTGGGRQLKYAGRLLPPRT